MKDFGKIDDFSHSNDLNTKYHNKNNNSDDDSKYFQSSGDFSNKMTNSSKQLCYNYIDNVNNNNKSYGITNQNLNPHQHLNLKRFRSDVNINEISNNSSENTLSEKNLVKTFFNNMKKSLISENNKKISKYNEQDLNQNDSTNEVSILKKIIIYFYLH